MADADVAITAGTGTKIDTRTVGAGTDEHRQVVILGDDGSTAVASFPAHDAADTGSPLKIGGRASSSAPAAVAANDRVNAWFGLQGQQVVATTGAIGTGADDVSNTSTIIYPLDAGGNVGYLATVNSYFDGTNWDRMRGDTLGIYVGRGNQPHNVNITPLGIKFTATTTQTSVNLLAGTGGQRIYVTHLNIATGGTTAGRVSIYYGTGAFTAGTSETVFDGEFAPSTTSRPGAVMDFSVPIGGASATGDNLRITTSAGITVYVTGQAYKA